MVVERIKSHMVTSIIAQLSSTLAVSIQNFAYTGFSPLSQECLSRYSLNPEVIASKERSANQDMD